MGLSRPFGLALERRLRSSDQDVRWAAIGELDDVNRLLSFAADEDIFAFEAAAKRLDELGQGAALIDLAVATADFVVASAIMRQLKSQELFQAVLRSGRCALARATAASKVDDQDLLADKASSDSDRDVRCICLEQLPKGHHLVSETATNDPDEHVRSCATGRLVDDELLRSIIANDSSALVRSTALRRIAGQDEELLHSIATNDPDGDVRLVAVEQLGLLRLANYQGREQQAAEPEVDGL